MEETIRKTAKAPVLDSVQKSCAAAFTAEELVGIKTFFGGPVGQAWLEKSRTLMISALEDAVRDIIPRVLAYAEEHLPSDGRLHQSATGEIACVNHSVNQGA